MLRLLAILLLAGTNGSFGNDYTLKPAVVDDKTGNMADGHSEITWSSLPDVDTHTSGEAEEPHGGWRTYYSLMHSFVSSVFATGLPSDVVVKAVRMDEDLYHNYQSYTKYIIGYAICGGVGILFTLVFPFVSCCFCCCRCAGKCGGKRNQSDDDARNLCKKNVFTVIVIITTAFLGVGMAAILDNNDKMSDALTGTGETFKTNIDDVRQYLNNTVQQVERVVIDDIDFMEAVITRDLDNVAFLVGVPLRLMIEAKTDIRNTLTTAYRLPSDLITVESSLRAINSSFTVLGQSVTDMETKLSAIRTDLTQIFTACIAPGCPTPPPDISALTPGVDSTQFPDISGQITSVNDAMKTNLTEKIVDAEAELDGIPKRVQDDSEAARNDTKREISKLKDEIDPIITEFRDINSAVNDDASSIDDIETDIETYADLVRPYDQYRSYSSFGLFGMVLVVVIGNCLGIILAVLGGSSGNQPHERGCSSNSAGCLLMVSAGVVLSMSTIFMLLTTLTFVLGAPLEMIVCNNLRDLEKLKELENAYSGEGNYELGKLIHDDVSVALTISGLLRDCKDNKPIFEAVQLERRFDIDDLLNYSKYFDIKTELDKINVDLSTVNVFSTALKTQLDKFRDALKVDFNAFYTQTSTLTPADDLDNSVIELQNYADNVNNIMPPAEHTRLQAQITAIRTIQTADYVTVQKNIQTLNQSLVAMETSVSSVKPLIDKLETGLKDTDLYIQNNASGDISVFLGVYANRLLGVVDSYVARAESAVKTEIGRCEPVWNVYESIFIHTLCGGIVDAVNGFWFSLGWCVFFFLPSLVFSVKLAKYFKRMEPPASESYNQPAPQRQMSLADQWLKRNKVYHRDNERDW